MPRPDSDGQSGVAEAVPSGAQKASQVQHAALVDLEHPWLGLESFREETRAYFFGRDAEIAELHLRLRSHPLLVLYSRSGLGKTSILSAGLMPRLRQDGLRPTLERLHYTDDVGEIYSQLFAALCNPQIEGGIRPFVPSFVHVKDWMEKLGVELGIDLPIDSPSRLWLRLHRRPEPPGITHLILDQFEEVFTLGAKRPGAEDELRDALAILLQGAIPEPIRRLIAEYDRILDHFDPDSTPVRVILSLRDDFVYALNRWRRHLPSLGQNNFELRSLRGLAAFDAVFKPGELRCHYRGEIHEENKADTGLLPIVSKETAERIVRFVAEKGEDVPIEEIEAVPPILSLLCRELNLRRFPEPGGTESAPIAQISFREGDTDIEKIIAAFYERCLAGRPEAVRIFIEEDLVSISGARLQQDQESILKVFAGGCEIPGAADDRRAAGYGDLAKARECLGDLVTQRLITSLGGSENPNYELVHDLLAGVVEKSRTDRELRFEKEQAERHAEERLREEREAGETRQREEALRRAERERRKDRRIITGISLALLLTIACAIFAATQWVRAKNQSRIAYSRELAAGAVAQLSADPELSVLLAVEAVKISRTEQAEEILRKALFESHVRTLVLGPTEALASLALSPNSQFVITSLTNGGLTIWEAQTGRTTATLRPETNRVTIAALSPDGHLVVTAGEEHTARLWDARTGRLIASLAGHSNDICSAAFSPDGKLIATTSWDATARVWDAKSGTNISVCAGHTDLVTGAAFSSDGLLVATTSADRTAHVWEALTGSDRTNFVGHTERINNAAFSTNGEFVVTASDDKTAIVWEVETAQGVFHLVGHTDSLNSVAFSPDGELVVTASKNGTARVWVTKTGELVATLRGHHADVLAATFTADGRAVITLGAVNAVRLWDPCTGQRVAKHDDSVFAATFSPDARLVVTASSDGANAVWETSSGRYVTNLIGHAGQVTSLAFSSDGQRVVTASYDNTARLWDTRTWSTNKILAGHTAAVNGAAFSPDARLVITASADNTARVWDTRTGETMTNLTKHTRPLNGAAFSSDGRLIVTASQDKTASVWDVAPGRTVSERLSLPHSDAVIAAAFSEDGQQLLTASGDNKLWRWEMRSGRKIGSVDLKGLAGPLTTAAFDPGGRFAITTSFDGTTAQLWDTGTGHLVAQLKGHGGELTSAAFSSDGKLVVTASTDRTARVYSTAECGPIDDLLALAAHRVIRELTPEERRTFLH